MTKSIDNLPILQSTQHKDTLKQVDNERPEPLSDTGISLFAVLGLGLTYGSGVMQQDAVLGILGVIYFGGGTLWMLRQRFLYRRQEKEKLNITNNDAGGLENNIESNKKQYVSNSTIGNTTY